MGPEDGPEVAQSIASQRLLVEETAFAVHIFVEVAAIDCMGTGALVASAFHLALKIVPELVQANGDFTAFTEVVVIDHGSGATQLSHEAVGARVVVPPRHVLAHKVARIVREMTLIIGVIGVSGGNQSNCEIVMLASTFKVLITNLREIFILFSI